MNYIEEALQTKSNQFNGELVSRKAFKAALSDAIAALQRLDAIKKALFYGRANDANAPTTDETPTCENLKLSRLSKDPYTAFDLLHGIIGKATESGELLEALEAAVVNEHSFSYTNVIEEVGDGLWYDAVILSALNSNFERAQHINIAKLRVRFQNKFSAYDAKNRNLEAENKVLTEGVKKQVDEVFKSV